MRALFFRVGVFWLSSKRVSAFKTFLSAVSVFTLGFHFKFYRRQIRLLLLQSLYFSVFTFMFIVSQRRSVRAVFLFRPLFCFLRCFIFSTSM